MVETNELLTRSDDESGLSLTPRSLVLVTVIGTIAGVVLFVAGLGGLIYSYWTHEGFNPRTVSFWVGVGGLIAGLAGFLGLLGVNQKYASTDPFIRQTLTVYNFVLVVCFLAGILIIFNLLVTQYGYLVGLKTYDWTSEGVYTLHDQTINQLKNLDRKLQIKVLYPPGRKRQQIEELLDLYEAQNPQLIDYDVVNYLEDRVETEKLLRQYPELAGQLPGILVIYGQGGEERHKVIKDSELFTFEVSFDPAMTDFSGTQTTFNGENALTSAIRELRQARKTKVYFTVGHGELDTDDQDPQSLRGIGRVIEELKNQAVEVATLNLSQKEVPEDADVVVIAGPRAPFRDEEIRRLRDYLDRKDNKGRPRGTLLVLVDAPLELRRGVPHDLNLNRLLSSYKVQLQDNVAVDRTAAYGGAAEFVALVPSLRTAHAVLKPLAGEQIMFNIAREVKTLESSDEEQDGSNSSIKAETILTTAGRDPLAWAEGNYETEQVAPGGPEDSPGPVSLIVAVVAETGQSSTPPSPGANPANQSVPRMIVAGDATFVANPFATLSPSNMYFFFNAIHWLGGRIEDVGIPPKTKKTIRLILDRTRFFTLIFEPGFAILGAIGVLAGMVWVVRTGRYSLAWIPLVIVLLFWCGLYASLARLVIAEAEPMMRTVLRVAAFCGLVWLVGVAYAAFAYMKARKEESEAAFA